MGGKGSGGGTFGLVAMALFQGWGWVESARTGGADFWGRCGKFRIMASPTSSHPSEGKSASSVMTGSSLSRLFGGGALIRRADIGHRYSPPSSSGKSLLITAAAAARLASTAAKNAEEAAHCECSRRSSRTGKARLLLLSLPALSPSAGATAENLKFMESLTFVAVKRFFGLSSVSRERQPRLIGRQALFLSGAG